MKINRPQETEQPAGLAVDNTRMIAPIHDDLRRLTRDPAEPESTDHQADHKHTPTREPVDPDRLLGALDQRYGAGAPDRHAVRKPAHHARTSGESSADPSALRDDESIEVTAMVAGLRAAQHALDDTRFTDSHASFHKHALVARRHLEHAAEVAKLYGATRGEQAVFAASASFTRALSAFSKRAQQGESVVKVVLELTDANTRFRASLGLDHDGTIPDQYQPELKPDASYVTAAITETFDLIATRARDALSSADRKDANRDTVITDVAADVVHHAGYASWLLQQLGTTERETYRGHADRAANAMLRTLTWITRQAANAKMRRPFGHAVEAVDAVLRVAGVIAIDQRPTPALTARQDMRARAAHAELVADESVLHIAIDALRDAAISGITMFDTLATIEDPKAPSFVADVAKAILVATIGHLTGAVASGLAVGTMITEIIIDSVQGIAGKVVEEAFAATRDKNEQTRLRVFFVAGLGSAVRQAAVQQRERVIQAIAADELTSEQIEHDVDVIRSKQSTIQREYRLGAAVAWASYLAQSHLGSHGTIGEDRHGRRVSNMNDYFGTPNASGDREPRSGRHGGDGVLRVQVEIDEVKGDAVPLILSSDVAGMNADMKAAILASARGRIDQIWLPKEIYVVPRHGHGRAVLAIDERNRLRDSTGWNDVKHAIGHLARTRTPEQFWSTLANSVRI